MSCPSLFTNALAAWCAFVFALTLAHGGQPDPSDPLAGRSHWAFQPLAMGKLIPHRESHSPIDDYVRAKWQEANLQPVQEAAPRDLIRRVYFQLIGLPPTWEQAQGFVSDPRADALARVVDVLLESPRFGERWGRHWLDLARYADSNGLDENFLFREAWRYRNWVVAAVNADLPYDRFILEQIAGDLLPGKSIEQRDRQRIAAGFLVLGPKVLLGNDANNQKMEVADEQIDTIGRSLLGLTLGCARCHDHKFEPIPTADYYAMAGIFTSTTVMEQRYMLGQQRVMEKLVGLGEEGDALQAHYEQHWRDLPKMKEALERAKEALTFIEKKDAVALKELVAKHADALAKDATDDSRSTEERMASQKALIAEREAIINHPPAIPPRAMIPSDRDSPSDEAIRINGQFNKLGDKVPRGYLQVLGTRDAEPIPKDKSGRVELGRWLTDVEKGAGLLTARVMANRVWHHVIGVGLVRTVDNFGRTGEMPSHPELLDYLASELIRSEWSLKALVRKIVLSETFALSSGHSESAHAVDPDNRLLWRAHRRRLDPESLRDAILSAAGQLDVSWTDSTVSYLGDQATAVGKNENRRRTDFSCRSVYLPVIRNDLPELFEAFDFADPHATTGARSKTNDATQGLFLLNDKMVMDAAEAAAKRLCQDGDAGMVMDRLCRTILSKPPTIEERNHFVSFVTLTKQRLVNEGDPEPAHRTWSLVCHALFSLSRFQFLE